MSVIIEKRDWVFFVVAIIVLSAFMFAILYDKNPAPDPRFVPTTTTIERQAQ